MKSQPAKKLIKKSDFNSFFIDGFKKSRKFWEKRINYNYFNLFREFPLLIQIDAKYGINKKECDKIEKVLIVNTNLLGDFIVSLPAIKYYTEKNPDARIDLIVTKSLLPLANIMKGINKAYSMKNFFQKGSDTYPGINGEYDLVILMRIPKKINKLLKSIKFTSIRTYFGAYLNFGMSLFRSFGGSETVKQLNKVNFEVIGEKDLEMPDISVYDLFNFKSNEVERTAKRHDFIKGDKKVIVIHTGSGWEVKFWSYDKWVELLNRINDTGNYNFVFVGATEQEEEAFKYINSQLEFKIFSVINQLNLKELMLLFMNCNYFIGIDSGPRHIAHLTNLKSVVLLGPGPKSYDALNRNAITIDKSDCACTNLACFQKETCMDKITVDEVFEAFRKI